MSKRIAVLIDHDYVDVEYAQPVEAFRAAKHSICHIAAESGTVVYGKFRTSCTTIDQSIDSISVDDFDALFIPGGDSALKLADHAMVLKFIQQFDQAKKSIFSLCDASLLLGEADILKDRIITSIRSHATCLIQAGGIYYDAELVNDNNQLISSRMPADLPVFIHECLHVLRT